MALPKIYNVWNADCVEETSAEPFAARSPEEAVELYVESDTDGIADGMYTGPTGVLLDVRLPCGGRTRVRVWVDFNPSITAVRAGEVEPQPDPL